MRYPHILAAFAAEPWAVQPEKLQAVVSFLAFKASGGDYTADEIAAKIDGRTMAATARAGGDIAVLPVMGLISQRMNMLQEISGGTSTEQLGSDFRAAMADDSIKAVVLDFDSPGGTSFGIQELASEIFAARGSKPIIAQVNSVAASAAYWLAAQADEIVVTPSGLAGSIGVYSVHEDVSQALEMAGVKPTLVKAGENKGEGLSFMPLSAAAQEAMQARINQTYDAFVGAVAAGRGVSAGQVNDRFGQGRAFQAADLMERGMADRVGTMRETLVRLGAASAPLRGGPGRQMRTQFAAGETPSLKLFEAHLRDGGCPDALATAFVSLGKGALRQGDPGDEATIRTREQLRAMSASLEGFSLPKP